MEKTREAVLLPLDSHWSDIGSWSALWQVQEQDNNGNVIRGDVIAENVSGSYLRSENRLLAAMGVQDCIIIETADAVLVANKAYSQHVKEIVAGLRDKKREEVVFHRRVYRPWGYYEVLCQEKFFQVKRIVVKPKASLSLQVHQHRSEHWVVIKGYAEVTRGKQVFTLSESESTYIPKEVIHRLVNPSEEVVEIIEIQLGTYLDENDIVRLEDTYGREATLSYP